MMSNDTEMIRSALTFGGGALGFCGALIVFINSRLQNAKTPDERNNLFTMLFVVAEPILWLLGVIFLSLFASKSIGMGFAFFAYLIHCGLFLKGRTPFLKLDILVLAWQSMGILFLALAVILSSMISIIGQGFDCTEKNTEAIGKIVDIIDRTLPLKTTPSDKGVPPSTSDTPE